MRLAVCVAALCCAMTIGAVRHADADTLPEALVRIYQTNPTLNAERARQRATDENVPQALSAFRPQISGGLSVGLNALRNVIPGGDTQSATLYPWTAGITVNQTLFNGFKTANQTRQAEAQVQSGRQGLRNVEQSVLLDGVTAYMDVLSNQSLVEAQRANVAALRETQGTTRKRLDAGDVTPTDVSQAEARLSRGLADLNTAEVTYAVSQAVYKQVIGVAPGRLAPVEPVDNLLPRLRDEAVAIARREQPAVLAAGFDTDAAQLAVNIAQSSLYPNVTVQGNVSRQSQTDTTLGTTSTDSASVVGQAAIPLYDGGLAASQTRQAKETVTQNRILLERIRNQAETAVVAAWVTNEGAPHRRERGRGRGPFRRPGDRGRAEGIAGRPAHDARRAQCPAGPDGGALAPDCGAARPGDRFLYAAQRHRPARRETARPQHARLHARHPLPAGARCLARLAHPVRPVERFPVKWNPVHRRKRVKQKESIAVSTQLTRRDAGTGSAASTGR